MKVKLEDKDFLPEAPSVNEFGGDDYHVTDEADKSARGDFVEEGSDDDEGMVVDVKDEDNQGDDAEGEVDDAEDEGEQEEDDGEADEEDEGEQEDDDDAEDEDEDEIPNSVPRSRLNKEVEKRKKLEQQIREMKAKIDPDDSAPQMEDSNLPASFEVNIDEERFEKMQDAMLEGETKDALGLFKGMLQDVAKNTAEFVTQTTSEKVMSDIQIREQNQVLAKTAESVYESYPEFDHSNEDADTEVISEVIDKRDFYIEKRKLAPDVALRRAADEVANEYGIENRKQSAPPKVKKKKNLDLARKTKLAEKESGKLKGSSEPSKKAVIDIEKLSDEQWAKLSPEAKAKARGDFL